jgi:hypothetical protein
VTASIVDAGRPVIPTQRGQATSAQVIVNSFRGCIENSDLSAVLIYSGGRSFHHASGTESLACRGSPQQLDIEMMKLKPS